MPRTVGHCCALALGLASWVLAGCATTAPAGGALADAYRPLVEPSPEGWGTTTIALGDHLRWPYQLQAVALTVDGVLVYRKQSGEGLRIDPGEAIAVVELEPGDHTVALKAVAGYRATPLSSPTDCRIELNTAQGIRVTWAPAAVELDLHLAGGNEDFHRRVALDVRVRGAERIEHQVLPHRAHDLRQPDSPDALLAGVQARIEAARVAKDVVAVLCYEDKHAQVRTLLSMRADRQARLQRAAAVAEAEHQRLVLGVIDAKLAQLWAETNQCVSSDGYVVEATQRAVVDGDAASCTAAGPLLDDEDADLLGMWR